MGETVGNTLTVAVGKGLTVAVGKGLTVTLGETVAVGVVVVPGALAVQPAKVNTSISAVTNANNFSFIT